MEPGASDAVPPVLSGAAQRGQAGCSRSHCCCLGSALSKTKAGSGGSPGVGALGPRELSHPSLVPSLGDGSYPMTGRYSLSLDWGHL